VDFPPSGRFPSRYAWLIIRRLRPFNSQHIGRFGLPLRSHLTTNPSVIGFPLSMVAFLGSVRFVPIFVVPAFASRRSDVSAFRQGQDLLCIVVLGPQLLAQHFLSSSSCSVITPSPRCELLWLDNSVAGCPIQSSRLCAHTVSFKLGSPISVFNCSSSVWFSWRSGSFRGDANGG
jgi:hypothetical protein